MNTGLTFRSSKIVYYGPHACSQCGLMICKMGQEFGGNAFTYPDGPIYPNTEWHVHVCNPRDIQRQKAIPAKNRVIEKHPTAQAVKAENLGWFITAASDNCLSGVQTYYDTEDAAWIGAKSKVFTDDGEQHPVNDVIRKNRPAMSGS
jgi:hypothetical protein